MLPINEFIHDLPAAFAGLPWETTANITATIQKMIGGLGEDYLISNGTAIHKTATIEDRAILKPPFIIGPRCFVGANAYLRAGVYLGEGVSVGPGCEIKSSVIMNHTAIAHQNFIGDSIIGNHVNFEAGSITANHFNERADKNIHVLYNGKIMVTGTQKFGCLAGDHSRIGANAVLSPGTLLPKGFIVKRLELVEQVKY